MDSKKTTKCEQCGRITKRNLQHFCGTRQRRFSGARDGMYRWAKRYDELNGAPENDGDR